ncbi:DUF1194 domain-containing protein [Roseovarius sp. 2305UL8-3]|uniref:DUF1194 domain-containing protein n=1 Tax=Roseovarius conchicola TaxID=3121636 RepID=UPI003528A1C6
MALILWAGIAQANCRLALVLALDVSSSVDAVEYDLQRVGLAAALDADEVRDAILSGGPGDVALAVYEWSGFFQHKTHLDWVWLRSHADIDAAVRILAKMERSHDDFPTAVGQALGYGATLMERGPDCDRKVIDMSGDGINNYGFGPQAAYRNFPFEGITVNGLVILGHSPEVLRYYHYNVVRGRNAFVITANGFEEFRDAMTRKLYREINDIVLGDVAPSDSGLPQPDPPG